MGFPQRLDAAVDVAVAVTVTFPGEEAPEQGDVNFLEQFPAFEMYGSYRALRKAIDFDANYVKSKTIFYQREVHLGAEFLNSASSLQCLLRKPRPHR